MNSTFGNDRRLRHRIGEASVALPRARPPARAAPGDPVTLSNATGSSAAVVSSDAVPPGVA